MELTIRRDQFTARRDLLSRRSDRLAGRRFLLCLWRFRLAVRRDRQTRRNGLTLTRQSEALTGRHTGLARKDAGAQKGGDVLGRVASVEQSEDVAADDRAQDALELDGGLREHRARLAGDRLRRTLRGVELRWRRGQLSRRRAGRQAKGRNRDDGTDSGIVMRDDGDDGVVVRVVRRSRRPSRPSRRPRQRRGHRQARKKTAK